MYNIEWLILKKIMVANKKQQLTAVQVAKYFLSLDSNHKYFVTGKMPKISGIAIPTIGNFRLNKLLHISQILYAAKEGEYLFSDKMWAFEHGGIIYEVYRQFHFLVKQTNDETNHLNLSTKSFLDKVFHYFRKIPNEELEEFVHGDPAWTEVWNQESNWNKEMPRGDEFINYYQKSFPYLIEEIGL